MIKTPKLKSYLTVFPISDTTWGVRGGSDELWRLKMGEGLAMRAFSLLLPFLNGLHDRSEIVEKLGADQVPADACERILDRLEAAGLIEEAGDGGLSADDQERFRDQIRFFSRFSLQGGQRLQAKLAAARVGLLGDGRLCASMRRQLEETGIGQIVHLSEADSSASEASNGSASSVHRAQLDREEIWSEPSGELPDLLLVPQEGYDPALLEAVDRFSKKHDLPWMLVRYVDFQEGWVGPLFVPGDTACYLSFDARLRGNLPFYDEHLSFDEKVRASGEVPATIGGLHAFFDLLAAAATVEVVKLLSDIRVPFLAGKFLSINLWNWEVEVHEVLRIPRADGGLTARPTPFPWKEYS